jgi:hypothetical protein
MQWRIQMREISIFGLDAANHALVQLKSQQRTGEPHNAVAKTVCKSEGLLSASGASLVYAGYPYDPLEMNSDPR